MIYNIVLYCLLAMVLVVAIGSKFDSQEPWVSIFATAALVCLVTGSLGLFNFIFSSRAPLKEYAQELHQQMPSLKGKLICDDDILKFKGTQDVQFEWKNQSYQIAYPVTATVSRIATSCPLNVKPLISTVVARLRDRTDLYPKIIEQTLKDKTLPKDVTSEEQQLLNRLLLTLNPVAVRKVTVLSTEGTAGSKLTVADQPNSPESAPVQNVKKGVPAKATPAKKESAEQATGITTQEMLKNISAQ